MPDRCCAISLALVFTDAAFADGTGEGLPIKHDAVGAVLLAVKDEIQWGHS